MIVLFFFQAEDGIRDHCVTGVQTCALPISGGIYLVRPTTARTRYMPPVSARSVRTGTGLWNCTIDRKSVVRERVEITVVVGSLKKTKQRQYEKDMVIQITTIADECVPEYQE